jgi:hypothetical protein
MSMLVTSKVFEALDGVCLFTRALFDACQNVDRQHLWDEAFVRYEKYVAENSRWLSNCGALEALTASREHEWHDQPIARVALSDDGTQLSVTLQSHELVAQQVCCFASTHCPDKLNETELIAIEFHQVDGDGLLVHLLCGLCDTYVIARSVRTTAI